MKLAIQLLEQKNNYLVQFKKIGDFECRRLQSGDYSHIEQFYYSRQIILDAIGHIDEHLKRYNPKNISKNHKETVLELLQKNREIIKSILQKDMLIHSYLNDLQYDVVEDQIA